MLTPKNYEIETCRSTKWQKTITLIDMLPKYYILKKERLKIKNQVAIGSLLSVLSGQNVRFYTRKATTTHETRFIVSTPEGQKKL